MKKIKMIFALALAFFITAGTASFMAGSESAGTTSVPDSAADITDKNEAVYARLSGAGEVQSIYVVNQFTLRSGGNFTDFGNYSAVVNLTDLEPLTLSDGEVSIRTGSENFFYQGNLAGNDLPWTYDIAYSLDGNEIPPENLAGQSGSLEIRLLSAKNGAVSETFYNNYLQQITITLDIHKCANIEADGAAAANAGKNRILAFTVLPGVDADITIKAEVTDFEMAGIEITAMPFAMSIEIPDTANMLDDFMQLSDAIAALSDGTGSLKDGMAEMAGGAEELRNGSSDFNNGLSRLNNSSPQLTEASAQFQAALSQIAEGLQSMSGFVTDPAMQQLIAGISGLSENYGEFHGGLVAYTQGINGLANGYGELDYGIAGLSGGIAELYGGMAQLHEGTARLANETSDMPGQFQNEIDKMLNEYTGGEFEPISFTSSENNDVSFVQFVFMTESIEKPDAETASQINVEQETFWTRLTKLFS